MMMKRNIAIIMIMILFFIGGFFLPPLRAETRILVAGIRRQVERRRSIRLETVQEIFKKADHYYDTRDNPGHAEQAILLYKKIIEIDRNNHEACWKLARSYKWQGDMATTVPERLAAYKNAKKFAQSSVTLKPESVKGHLMLGISYGLIGGTVGGVKSIHLISLVKEEMNIVLAKEPGNEIAHLVYGVLYRVLPRFLGGSKHESVQSLQKAIQINPHRTTHYLELAKSYIEKGEKESAKKTLLGLLQIRKPTDLVQAKSDREDAVLLMEEIS